MAYTTIDDPSAHFQIALWTGDGATPSITNDGNSDLQPDLLWGKNRTGTADHHYLIDSTRGTGKYVLSNSSSAEITNAAISSFNTDGFTLTTDVGLNRSSSTFVGWQWKANGGTTTTNDASSTGVGSQDSVYQANTTAGFSIVTYGPLGSGGTIAHGLGTTPHLMFVKSLGGSRDWAVYHHKLTSAPETDHVHLNENHATADETIWNDTAPTSTVFSVSGDGKVGTDEAYVAYCFAEVQGYSKFGTYTGNNSANGAFIYTGFKPAFFMWKRYDHSTGWGMIDSTRNPYNQGFFQSGPDDTDGNADYDLGDFLSNGLKWRNTFGDTNSVNPYIYMAFAENPFVSSEGVPCTAR